MTSSTPDWETLNGTIAGEVTLSGSAAYDRGRLGFNARYHDVLPEAIVSCATTEDVSETIAFVHRYGLVHATRSRGHCFAGHSSTRGVLIDVTALRSVSVAGGVATVGAGTRLGDVYEGLEAHGLTIPAGTCPPVGIARLVLGGGLGILGRTYGTTSDHLLNAQIVLADGRVIECDEHHDEDLFWALRGAGAGNFGVVTSFVFRTVPATGGDQHPRGVVASPRHCGHHGLAAVGASGTRRARRKPEGDRLRRWPRATVGGRIRRVPRDRIRRRRAARPPDRGDWLRADLDVKPAQVVPRDPAILGAPRGHRG
jgi:hypothetical protein